MRKVWSHPLSTYAKFSEQLTFLTPWYVHVRVRIRGLEMLVFRKILRTYLMDEPFGKILLLEPEKHFIEKIVIEKILIVYVPHASFP